jgi:hypothetical protein
VDFIKLLTFSLFNGKSLAGATLNFLVKYRLYFYILFLAILISYNMTFLLKLMDGMYSNFHFSFVSGGVIAH